MPSQSTMETLKPIIQTYSILAITLAAGRSTPQHPTPKGTQMHNTADLLTPNP